jgi:protein ImuA
MTREPHRPAPDRSPSPQNGAMAEGRLAGLRSLIHAIERGGAIGDGEAVPLGVPAIDARLGGGLAVGALHEIAAADAGAASAFAAALAARLARQKGGAVLWCASPHALEAGALYGPGLRALGLDPARLVAVSAARGDAVLWAMEEGLRCTALAAVIGETDAAGPVATRRLQLAAAAHGVTALLLRPAMAAATGGAPVAATRWRISAAPSQPRGHAALLGLPGAACWKMELIRCRAGAPGAWVVEWRDETGDFALAAPLRDRPAGVIAGRPDAAGETGDAVRAGA